MQNNQVTRDFTKTKIALMFYYKGSFYSGGGQALYYALVNGRPGFNVGLAGRTVQRCSVCCTGCLKKKATTGCREPHAVLLVVWSGLVKTLVQHSGRTGSPIDSAHFSK